MHLSDYCFHIKLFDGKMLPSSLNKLITIEVGVPSTNAVDTPIMNWAEYIVTYANVFVPTINTQFLDGELYTLTTNFTIRYNSKTKYLNNKYRILYNGMYYKILQVYETEIRHTLRVVTISWEDE